MELSKKKIEGFRLYIITFTCLSLLTLLAVWLTKIRLASHLVVGFIMLIAFIQAGIVLLYNMHLKFNEKILRVFVAAALGLMFLLMIVTMLDYIYR